MATRKVNRRALRQYEESEGLAARARAGVEAVTKKRAASKSKKVAKRETRAQREVRRWGPTGQARVSQFYVDNVTRERDEAMARLLTEQKQAEWSVQSLNKSVNLLDRFVAIFTSDQAKTSEVVRAVLEATAMIGEHWTPRNQQADYRVKA